MESITHGFTGNRDRPEDTWLTQPEPLMHALDERDAWPDRMLLCEDYAESTLELLPWNHANLISNAQMVAGLVRSRFTYALGVRVGRALAAGVEIDTEAAERLIAEAVEAWTAESGDCVDELQEANALAWRAREDYRHAQRLQRARRGIA